MAEVRKITIEIVDGGSGKGAADGTKKEKESTFKDDLKEILHPVKTFFSNRKNGENEFLILNYAYNNAKSVIFSSVSATLQREFSLSENYIAQQTYANASRAIGAVESFAGSVISGALVGAKFGPFGALAGSIISGTVNVVSQYNANQNRLSSYYQSLNASNYQSDFSQVRAGLIDGSRGTEN